MDRGAEPEKGSGPISQDSVYALQSHTGEMGHDPFSAAQRPQSTMLDGRTIRNRIESETFPHQVANLDVDCRGRRITVTGRSRSFYVKQLVTHAVLSAVPDVRLENKIRVRAM